MILEGFCEEPFWDLERTWGDPPRGEISDPPDFTECFEQTVLAWIPCAFLWAFAGIDVYNSLHSRGRDIPWTALNVGKSSVTIALVILQLFLLGYAIHLGSNDHIVYPVEIYTPIIRIITLLLALFLIIFSKSKGVRSSGVQFLFWFLFIFCEVFSFRTAILNSRTEGKATDTLEFTVEIILFPLLICQFLLSCWADAIPQYKEHVQRTGRPCPEEEASFLSRLLFFWFEGLAWRGYRKPLEYEDLWELNPEDKSRALVPIFDKYWHRSLENAKIIPEARASFRTRSGSIDFRPIPRNTNGEASVFPTLVKAFGPTFLFGAFLKLTQDLLAFVSPQILKLLISYVQNEKEAGWKGYFYAILLIGTSTIQTLILAQYFHRMFLVGMRIRTTIVSAIYRKALLISNSARKDRTVGEIVNLMSVDAQRFMDLTAYLNMLWSAPLQIGLSLFFLWQTLGPSVLAGLVVMVLLVPINSVIASMVKKLQIKQMKYKDQRVKLMNEILSGIKVLKLYAWEPSFEDQVMKIRGKEIEVLKSAAYLNAGAAFLWTCAPFLVAVATFAAFVLMDDNNVLDAEKAFVALSLFNLIRMPMSMLPMMIMLTVQVAVLTFTTYVLSDDENVLDAEKAFVSLSLFNLLRFPMSMFPTLMSSIVQASVSLKRLNKYMNAEQIDPNSVSHDTTEADPIVVENGTFSWEPETMVLKDINLRVKEGSLVGVVGTVGSGKSSLLSAILGELEKQTGRVNTKGSVAYTSQLSWIQNATLRNNILFGRPFDPTKYERVIEACALKPDLDILPARDKTEIGEKGINLSGGQKQRVSLARATYNNADLYLLDDPLSAVDAHVGKHIFENVIGPKGLLKRKTRLLVTHGITYLPEMDHIIVIKDGEISESGTYKELLAKKGAFAEFLIQHIGAEEVEIDETNIIKDLEQVIGAPVDTLIARQRTRVSESESLGDYGPIRRPTSSLSQDSGEKSLPTRKMSKLLDSDSGKINSAGPSTRNKLIEVEKSENGTRDKLIEVEKSETGSVKLNVYTHYIRAVGGWMTFLTLFFNLIYQGFAVMSNIWLSAWSNEAPINNGNGTTQNLEKRDMYLGVYAGLGLGQGVMSLLGALTVYYGTLAGSSKLHNQMLRNILKNPVSFFDVTPLGRILNRFAKDVDTMDNLMGQLFRFLIICFYGVMSTLAVISYSTPIFIAVIVPTGILYYLVQRFYVETSRQLKRLESVSRSPIYSHFSETLTGCSTIRAYSMQDRFILESESQVDHNQIAYFPSIVSNRWLAVRLETVGNFIIFFAAIFAVQGRDTLTPGLVGLSISYALQITQTLNWLVRMSSDVETNIVAVERIKEYGEIPQEAAWEIEERKPPNTWPQNGEVIFDHFQTRYREGLDLVLKDITCKIEPGEKVGIVGRTGAGKSSLTLGLFRIVEAAGGSITIDGHNISKLGLHDLRGRLTIIPQDPVLFSGSMRINLDPFNYFTDDTIWKALELSHLNTFVRGLSAGLDHEISEGGENLSVGQRQLICLARALLRKTKILILDEATAAVDLETDDLIQQTIRTEFKNSTVLTIAHRLNTIMDSTRVLVLDKGEIREFDSPANLLKNKESIFYGMAKDSGLI